MDISIVYITMSILLFLSFYQVKTWRYRVLFSPAFYFSSLWFFGAFGLIIFDSLGIMIDKYPKYIDELNILISFTALCFIIFTKMGKKKVNMDSINIGYINTLLNFKILSFFLFLTALFVFISEGSGLDFGKARDTMHETMANRNVIIGYIRLISNPLSIYAGYFISVLLTEKTNYRKSIYIFLILPFLSNLLFSFAEGGRVSMVFSLIVYLFGFGLAVPLRLSLFKNKKIIFVLISVFITINVVISWVGSIRATADKNTNSSKGKELLGVFSPIYGISEYMYSSYVGYQFRRVDATSNELGYGIYTFNGFINWNIPFLSQLGIEKTSIADYFDVYYHNQETYDFKRPYYYMTNSSYIPIIKDFGFKGAFYFIIFLTYLTQYLFIKIQSKKFILLNINIFWFYLFLEYWVKSNFYGTLSSTILIPLYGFIIVDFFNFLMNQLRTRF